MGNKDYPFLDPSTPTPWLPHVESWLAELGRWLWMKVGFRMALIGFEFSGTTDAAKIIHNGGVPSIRDYGGFTAEEVYFEKKMANHHGGIVLVDGYLYGFGSGGLICMNFETGEITWQARSVSKGSNFYNDGRSARSAGRELLELVGRMHAGACLVSS